MKEVQNTDEAVAIALKYVLEHPDTALIVTADHETGNTTLKSGWKTDFNRITADSGNHSVQLVHVFAIGKGTEAPQLPCSSVRGVVPASSIDKSAGNIVPRR